MGKDQFGDGGTRKINPKSIKKAKKKEGLISKAIKAITKKKK